MSRGTPMSAGSARRRRGRRLREDPLWRALAALRPDPWRTLLAVLTGSAAVACAVGLMATSGWLISRAAQRPNVVYLEVAVVATRTFGIGRGVLRYLERLISHDVALRGVAELRERLYRRLAAAEPATVAGLRRGDLLARVGADVDTLADLVVRALLPFAVAATTALATVLVVGALLPSAGAVIGVSFLFAGAGGPWLAALAARRAEGAAAAARTRASAATLALLDGLGELTVAGAVPAQLAQVAEADAAWYRESDRAARPAALAAALGTLLTGAATLAALLIGVQAVAAGGLDPVLLAVVTLTPLAAAEALAGLPAAATGLVRARTAAARVLELLDVPPAPRSLPEPQDPEGATDPAGPAVLTDPPVPPDPAVPPDRAVPRPDRGPVRLRARGLACGWPSRPPVVRDLDLDLTPGRRVAVVGASGGGKSTLLLTLAGLLPEQAGQLEIEESGQVRNLHDLPVPHLRRLVQFTAEDAHVFTTTLRENLRVADPGATDDALRQALDRAGLGAWLDGLPDGLDTLLGSGGSDVSGGERRRVLLARALLVDAPVLLLDEPAEHLDPDTADTLLADLFAAAGPHRSVVVVTHRLAPLARADEVLILEGGRVSVRGSHEDLLRHHPGYAQSWAAESGATTRAVPTR